MHLHIEPESVRQLASQFNQMANTLGHEVDQLNGSVNHLAANWNAPGSTDFILTLQVLIHQIAAARDEAELLAHRIGTFVEEWEQRPAGSASGRRKHPRVLFHTSAKLDTKPIRNKYRKLKTVHQFPKTMIRLPIEAKGKETAQETGKQRKT